MSPGIRTLGKKMVWLAGLNKSFEGKNDFEKANELENNNFCKAVKKKKKKLEINNVLHFYLNFIILYFYLIILYFKKIVY